MISERDDISEVSSTIVPGYCLEVFSDVAPGGQILIEPCSLSELSQERPTDWRGNSCTEIMGDLRSSPVFSLVVISACM